MTSKADYTEEEWARLRRSPMIAGMAISIADPGGPIEITKETMATLKAASSPPSGEELLTALSQDIMAMSQRKENPIGDFKVDHSALAANQILDELRAANAIVTAKATPEEAEGFRTWMSSVAQAAADAAKEGGFMGFHAERVSAGEQAMLAKVAEALGSTSA
jgi:transcription antitermination factor NusG